MRIKLSLEINEVKSWNYASVESILTLYNSLGDLKSRKVFEFSCNEADSISLAGFWEKTRFADNIDGKLTDNYFSKLGLSMTGRVKVNNMLNERIPYNEQN